MELLQVLERWIAVTVRSPRTVDNYRWALGRLARSGIARVDDVTLHNVAHYVAERMSQVRAESLLVELAALTTLLRFLVRRGELARELLLAVRDLRPEFKKPVQLHARFHSRDEIERLCSAARKQRTEGDAAAFTIRLDTLSGLRLGELATLPWSNVDLERRVISVRLDPSLGDRGRIKTMRERLVPICSELRDLLRTRWRRDGYVFRAGRRASVNAISPTRTLWLRLVRARERAGIPDATFLTLRHTRASMWVQAGVPIAKVAHWMGHSPLTCSRFYLGLTVGYDADCEKTPDRLSA